MKILPKPLGFEWDKANERKNWLKHKVSNEECEQIFSDEKHRLWKDVLHSAGELRFVILGKTREGKILFVVFTLRHNRVRVISGRYANKKERQMYEAT